MQKMALPLQWSRLIRYLSKDGQIRYGEPQLSEGTADLLKLAQNGKLKVEILEGESALSAKPTGRFDEVESLYGPLTAKEVNYIRCIGLNYKTHSE